MSAMGRDGRGNQVDDVEIERRVGGKRYREMSVMKRIEGSAEQAEAAGRCHSLKRG